MKNIFYILLVVVFLSCESKTNYEKPKDLIPKDQMIDLLMDMHLVNGVTGIKSKDGSNVNDYMSVLYKKYEIDSTRFAASNLYYVSNISEYEDMFKEVEKRLGKQRILMEVDSLRIPKKTNKRLKRPNLNRISKDSILK